MVLRSWYVVIHSGVQKGKHYFLLNKRQVFVLSNFWHFVHWIVQVNIIRYGSLLVELNFFYKNPVKLEGLIGSIVPSLGNSLHEFIVSGL